MDGWTDGRMDGGMCRWMDKQNFLLKPEVLGKKATWTRDTSVVLSLPPPPPSHQSVITVWTYEMKRQ